jgi:hypothetical protein
MCEIIFCTKQHIFISFTNLFSPFGAFPAILLRWKERREVRMGGAAAAVRLTAAAVPSRELVNLNESRLQW